MNQNLNIHILLLTICFIFTAPLCLQAESKKTDVQLFRNATIITMDDRKPDSFRGYMTVDKEGRIVSIGEGSAPADLNIKNSVDLKGKIIAPGFVSAHNHIYMSPLLRKTT